MNLFVDYVQPLTNWLLDHPHWALFITFAIALSESLAIIGSIVPGSVTMTAIGILAGSGFMRIDLTLIAATLGAIVGDGLSYALGFYYSEKLGEIWPFSKYPTWLNYGKDFFRQHGGKSVFLGRFVGPLRSIIPVIAGVMHMKRWRFFAANAISAVLWSILYVVPGILIGAASHELSAESSTRLILLILVVLVGIWFITTVIKSVLNKLNKYVKMNLNDMWESFKKHRILATVYKLCTPKNELYHHRTALLVILMLLSIASFLFCLILSLQTPWFAKYNLPVHLLMQSFHSPTLEAFFIFCIQLTASSTLLTLYLLSCIWFVYQKDARSIAYTTTVLIVSSLMALGLAYLAHTPRPTGFIVTMQGSSLPPINLLIASAFYPFLLFLINNKDSLIIHTYKGIIYTILALSGFGFLYLGDNWFTDILTANFGGFTIALFFYLNYRKSNVLSKNQHQAIVFLSIALTALLVTASLSTYTNYKTIKFNHMYYQKEYSLKQNTWWNQTQPLLPIYLLNRIGQRLSLLNIQYSGDLDLLEQHLNKKGWKLHTESFLTKLLQRLSSKSKTVRLPLLDQLFENKQPELVMTYNKTNSNTVLELRLWESSYFLSDLGRPIWIGSLHYNKKDLNKLKKINATAEILEDPLTYIIPALNKYTLRRVKVSKPFIKSTIIPTSPYILLINGELLTNQ